MFASIRVASLIYSPDRTQTFSCPAGFLGDVPDWVAETDHFQELCRDGNASVSEQKKPVEKDAEKPVRRKKTE